VIRAGVLTAGMLALIGCTHEAAVAPPPRTIAATAPPAQGLWLGLRATAEHAHPVGYGPTLPWMPVSWVVTDGARVEKGGDLLRYDAELLSEWNARDAFDLSRDDLRKGMDLLRGSGDIERLRSRIRQLQARRAVVAAEIDAASSTDADEIRIAQLQLADARSEHAAAVRRRERLERIAAAGAPVSGADLARAREEEVKTGAAIAVPEVALELANLPAARSTVRRLRLSLADIDAQLGSTPEEGLEAELRTAAERQLRREADRGRGHAQWRRRQYEARLDVMADPAIHASIAGTAVLRSPDVRPGAKLAKDASAVFVLAPGGMSADLGIPERLRPLVAIGSRLALHSPSFGSRVVTGVVQTIAASPERGRDGVLAFPAQVRLIDPPEDLRPGMSADCQVAVDVAPSAAVIPSFCVIDPAAPAVVLADGSRRAVQGWSVGGWFVAVQGLAVGEHVRLPQSDAVAERLRLSALVEPAVFTPVRLRSWEWEVLEVLPEGSVVRQGDQIARLVKVDHWRGADQIRADADQAMTQGKLDLSIAQLAATDDRAAAQSAWVRARLERERARLEAWVMRNAYDAVAQARTAAALASAEVAHERAARELAAAEEERKAGGISDNRLREQRIALDKALAAVDRARLDAAVDELGPDWLELRRLDDATRAAAEAEEAQQVQAMLAGETFRAQLASAIDRFDGMRRWVDGEMRNLADEVVRAPADGVLVTTREDGSAPKPGEPVTSWEPFRIADGTARRATFEVPARLHGHIAVGDRLRLSAPGLEQEIEADVISVASSFMPPASFADEVALGRTIGVEERIFRVTVGFTPHRADQLPPGSTVHVDL
jgi:hypothetical protein